MGSHLTKAQLAQIVYKKACEGKTNKEIASDLEVKADTVKRVVRMNRYAIQKRAMQFVDSTLDVSMEVLKNNVHSALKVSKKDPDELTHMELSWQARIGMDAVDKSLEVGGILGSPNSQSGVTQNIFQQNNTSLSNNVKDFLKSMSDSLHVEEEEVIDGEYKEEDKLVELESTEESSEQCDKTQEDS